MFLVLLGFYALGVATTVLFFTKKSSKPKPLDHLKNALLSLSLNIVSNNDIDMTNMAYDTFDGTKLPMMSGCDPVNACTTYIVDKAEFRKDPWYTDIMEQKLVAIDKYLARKFKTDKDAMAFFTRFLEAIEKKKQN
jgi:hypothetical protein